MRRYSIELAASMAAYLGLLLLSNLIWTHMSPRGWVETAVVLMPMLAALATVWVILRQLRRFDEMQLRIQLEAFAIAFCGTALITFSYGFLEGLDYPKLSMFVVWPVMAVLWSLGLAWGHWRYR